MPLGPVAEGASGLRTACALPGHHDPAVRIKRWIVHHWLAAADVHIIDVDITGLVGSGACRNFGRADNEPIPVASCGDTEARCQVLHPACFLCDPDLMDNL